MAAAKTRQPANRRREGARRRPGRRAQAVMSAARKLCRKHLEKAVAAFKRDDYGKAAIKAAEAADADPSCGQAFHVLGLSLEHMGEMAKAVEMYEKAFALDPDDHDLYLHLGLAAGRWACSTARRGRSDCSRSPARPADGLEQPRLGPEDHRASTRRSRPAASHSCACRSSRCSGTRWARSSRNLGALRRGRDLLTARRCGSIRPICAPGTIWASAAPSGTPRGGARVLRQGSRPEDAAARAHRDRALARPSACWRSAT